ncbi:uncharacterized protein TrAFT101_000117 [Trichoderma asperellum]|uniref:uncharacterized protein n=1 Tax=Trichoderma asperellum TaxID=101201 RepID=UPI00332B52A7|nr:hypothetical protein TrAFT101_000117 [Trichoderma asperellum]
MKAITISLIAVVAFVAHVRAQAVVGICGVEDNVCFLGSSVLDCQNGRCSKDENPCYEYLPNEGSPLEVLCF